MGLNASVVRYGGGAALDPHAHADASVSIVLAGAIEEEAGGATEIGRIGSMVAKPAGVEHRNRVGKDGAILLAIKGPEVEGMATDYRWSRPGAAAAVGLQVARSLKVDAAADSEQLLDLLGLADRLVEMRRRSCWLDDIRRRLDQEASPPSVGDLARLAEVHPVYLARAFRGQFGCSIRDYRRQARVRRAAALLAGSTLPVAAIAVSLDFFDQSHLCRDFRAELKVSPSEYRAIVRG